MATKQDEVWICKDGTEVPVCELKEDHMRNIIRMIIRKNNEDESTLYDCTYEETL